MYADRDLRKQDKRGIRRTTAVICVQSSHVTLLWLCMYGRILFRGCVLLGFMGGQSQIEVKLE